MILDVISAVCTVSPVKVQSSCSGVVLRVFLAGKVMLFNLESFTKQPGAQTVEFLLH